MKPEQKPDKGGPKYTLEVRNVRAVLKPIFLQKEKEGKEK